MFLDNNGIILAVGISETKVLGEFFLVSIYYEFVITGVLMVASIT
jgi:hypothetical protein